MPLRLAGLSGQAPQPRQRCAEGAGRDGAGAARTIMWRAETTSESSRTMSPIAGHSVDLPEVTAFSSRFDAGDRRRIGEVGAGRSHPHRRVAQRAARTKRVASLASHPVPPSRETLPLSPREQRELGKSRGDAGEAYAAGDASDRRHWKTWPSRPIACSTTASLRASATRARRIPTRCARRTAQTFERTPQRCVAPQHAAGRDIEQPPDLEVAHLADPTAVAHLARAVLARR